jgi:hypothetical protein
METAALFSNIFNLFEFFLLRINLYLYKFYWSIRDITTKKTVN